MTPEQYISPKLFPLTTQEGLDVKQQMFIDAVNHDEIGEHIDAGGSLTEEQQDIWGELQEKHRNRDHVMQLLKGGVGNPEPFRNGTVVTESIETHVDLFARREVSLFEDTETGFTGIKVDTLNRKQYYRNGVHIAAPSDQEKSDIETAHKKKEPGKRIAVLGMAADPVHRGHVEFAKHVRDKGGVDEVWLMPVNKHAFGKNMATPQHRINMLQKATAGEPGLHVSDFEVRHGMHGAAIDRLHKLKQEYPQHDFSFAIAADNANDFHKWHRNEELAREVPFIVQPRKGTPLEPQADWAKQNPHQILPEGDIPEVSSTAIRKKLVADDPTVTELIHPDVFDYIKEHKLYGHKPAIKELFNRVAEPDGGFTYKPQSGEAPNEGYVLSVHPERSISKPVASLTVDDICDFIVKNTDLLADAENYLGAWHDPASGQVFLDVSTIKDNEADAHRLAVDHDQIAYFNLRTKKAVTVNPEATSGGQVKRDKHGSEKSAGVAIAETADYSGQGGGTVPILDGQEAHSGGIDSHSGTFATAATEGLVDVTESSSIKLRFTGVVKDMLGRTYHYVNGERVAAPKHEAHVKAGGHSYDYEHHAEKGIAVRYDADFAKGLAKDFAAINKALSNLPDDLQDDTAKHLKNPAAIKIIASIAFPNELPSKRNEKTMRILRAMVGSQHKAEEVAEKAAEEAAKKAAEKSAKFDPNMPTPEPLSGGEIASKLVNSPIVNTERLGGGVNVSKIITLEDGTKAVFKPALGENPDLRKAVKGDYWKREVVASELAQLLGVGDLVPITVARGEGKNIGSAQHFVDGKTAAHYGDYPEDRYDGPIDLARAAVFDLLQCNTDRHYGNWMLKDGGKLVLIDNGLSFPDNHAGQFDVVGQRRFVDEASKQYLSIPDEVADWGKHADKIGEIMKHVGLSDKEIELTKERLGVLVQCAKDGRTVQEGWMELSGVSVNQYKKVMADLAQENASHTEPK